MRMKLQEAVPNGDTTIIHMSHNNTSDLWVSPPLRKTRFMSGCCAAAQCRASTAGRVKPCCCSDLEMQWVKVKLRPLVPTHSMIFIPLEVMHEQNQTKRQTWNKLDPYLSTLYTRAEHTKELKDTAGSKVSMIAQQVVPNQSRADDFRVQEMGGFHQVNGCRYADWTGIRWNERARTRGADTRDLWWMNEEKPKQQNLL